VGIAGLLLRKKIHASRGAVPRRPRHRPPALLLPLIPPPPPPTLFPYTTLFRSLADAHGADLVGFHELDVQTLAERLGQAGGGIRSEEHTSELQSLRHLVCRLLLEKKNAKPRRRHPGVAEGGSDAGAGVERLAGH